MRRLRVSMILGVLALAFSGCLSSSPDGAELEIDEVQNATSLDRTVATDPAQVAAQAATPAALHGPCRSIHARVTSRSAGPAARTR